ncbi:MAG TPA: glycogen synthase GlgA [Bryobacteraceae bacterium]|nr:glycogen synthase GlgA [Bryobacteraceae bacterium]
MKILMVASEAAPFAKTGGLADVVGSLPAALKKLGHEVAVLLPRYPAVDLKSTRRVYDWLPVWVPPRRFDTSLYLIERETPFYFLDSPVLFDRPGLYGEDGEDYPDNHIRFAALAQAALEFCRRVWRPDVIHGHDWQAGLTPVYLHTIYANDPTFFGIRTLFTVHNVGYHGLFPAATQAEIGLAGTDAFRPGGLEFFGQVCYLKGGLNYSDALNTVSPAYAREIQTAEYGFGLDGVLRARSGVLSGILNGVDYTEWNPQTDRYIAANYSAADLAGKRACKEDLLRVFGAAPEGLADAMAAPLIGIVSRFTSQKGADLIAAAADAMVAEGYYLVALGAGEPRYEEMFHAIAARHPGRIAVRIGYDNALAHKIEAGADVFLMPSRYEPCGLNQMYSLKYGTVPVVRATGGLDDTIEPGTGFKFWQYAGDALAGALRAARAAFADPEGWQAIMRAGMAKDFSWDVSAAEYARLYRSLCGI